MRVCESWSDVISSGKDAARQSRVVATTLAHEVAESGAAAAWIRCAGPGATGHGFSVRG